MEEKIFIPNDEGLRLCGQYAEISDERLVVICHGLTKTKEHPSIVVTAKNLAAKGFSTLRFDFTGWGESEGKKSASILQHVGDIKSVVEAYSFYNEITLMGASYSALSTGLAALTLKQVTHLVHINGYYGLTPKFIVVRAFFGMLKWWENLHQSWREEMMWVRETFKPESLRVPVLVLSSPQDQVIDFRDSIGFYSKLRTRKQLGFLNGTGHEVMEEQGRRQALAYFLRWY